MKTKLAATIWFFLLVVLSSYVISLYKTSSFNFDSNILSLLPAGESNPAIDLAFEKFTEKNLKELFFLVKNTDLSEAKQSAQQLADAISVSPWLDSVSLEIGTEDQQAIANFNYQYRHHLLTETDAALLSNEDYSAFSDFVISQAYSPISGGLIELVQRDPFVLSYRFGVGSNIDSFPGLGLNDGFLVAEQEGLYYVLLTASLNESPFNQRLQQDLQVIFNEVEELWSSTDSTSSLLRTGALFYTTYAYETAQREISMIGGGSLLLIISLLIFTFKSIKPIFFVTLSIIFGILSGYCVVRFVFGEVHLLTTVFGGSLIGVAVDYIFHFLVVKGTADSQERVIEIFPAITLGLFSSLLGYAALILTPFPGLQQMALFCIAGLTGAYLTVILLFPILKVTPKKSEILLVVSQQIISFGKHPIAKLCWSVGAILPIFAALTFWLGAEHKEDIREFQAIDVSLSEQETEINRVLNTPAANQFYLAKGSSQEELLLALESAQPFFNDMIEAGDIDGAVNISQWLPSQARQEQNYLSYQDLYQSQASAQLVELGLISDQQVDSIRQGFNAEQGNYLSPQQWLESNLGNRMSYLWLDQVEDEFFAVVALRGVNPEAELTDISPDVLFVDKISTINNLLHSYRENTLYFFLLALVFIYLLLTVRFGLKDAALVLSAPIISISLTVLALQLFTGSVNLFNVLAFFLVLGIGVDFGIFFACTKKVISTTMLGISLSALTTIFSFGVLSISETTVIASYGLTMLIGISTVYLLSPIVGALLERKGESNL